MSESLTPSTQRQPDRLNLAEGAIDAAFWPTVCRRTLAWLAARGSSARDVIVLVPHSSLIGVLRSTFAQQGGWQPRVETVHTWAHGLGPPRPGASQLSLDSVTDAASAAILLRGQTAGGEWAARDAAGFDAAVRALVEAAQTLLRGAMGQPPGERDAWWTDWRDAMAAASASGPGLAERWLGRIALEWASSADASGLDRLWQQRPSAWMLLQTGASDDRLPQLLLQAADERNEPVLWLDAALPIEHPFDAAAQLPAPLRWVAGDLEGEAQAAALAVLQAVEAGRVPVGLVVDDRTTRGRIHALLRRTGLRVHDEVGDSLAATPPAARLMAALRAARPSSRRDDALDWLKAEHAGAPALRRLEAAWRRGAAPDEGTQAWLDAQQAPLRHWAGEAAPTLAGWLAACLSANSPLRSVLAAFADDPCGQAAWAALRLDGAATSAAWQLAAAQTALDLAGFIAWVETTLERSTFAPPSQGPAEVVIMSLARAALRPFGAIVMAGCDAQRLGGTPSTATLLPQALLQRFGLPHREALRQRELQDFAQLLRVPAPVLLRRRSDEAEALAPSGLLEQAWQARQRSGQAAPGEVEAPLPTLTVVGAPQGRPAPTAGLALPQRLTASAIEGLRDCPYRFFAHTVLGLRDSPELDAAVEKRDFGTWLHGVLQRFHDARGENTTPAVDRAALHAAAAEQEAATGFDAAELLPFRAAFDHFGDHYLVWLRGRDAEGWRYQSGELALRRTDPALAGVALEGRIDRVDVHAPTGTMQLVDYKTGSAQALKKKVADPLEDTQLAFYAALLDPQPGTPQVRAIYLALDDRKEPREFEHPDVQRSAEQLVGGLADELQRVRAGAGLPALGEAAVCEYCDARGLCRRDHWTQDTVT
ncbi:MAG: PD-(D/E)XK nuclease family protein [Burkholderiaceae bacterium]